MGYGYFVRNRDMIIIKGALSITNIENDLKNLYKLIYDTVIGATHGKEKSKEKALIKAKQNKDNYSGRIK